MIGCRSNAAQYIITGVPNYDQDIFPIDAAYASLPNDCTHIACTMLHGYYDANGWPRLIPYGGNYVTNSVWPYIGNAWGIDTVVRKYKTAFGTEGGVPAINIILGQLGNTIVSVINQCDAGAAFTKDDDDITSYTKIQSYLNANHPCVLAVTPYWYHLYSDSYKLEGSNTLIELPGGHAVCAVGWSDVGGNWIICNLGWNYSYPRAWFNSDSDDDWYISQITPGGTPSPEDDDAYEDNDTIGQAHVVYSQTIPNLRCLDTLIVSNNYYWSYGDWYKVQAVAGQTVSVSIVFPNANGNLDLQVYDPNWSVVGSSTGTTDSESVTVANASAGFYYIFVYGKNNAKNSNYTLSVNLVSPQTPVITSVSPATLSTSGSPQTITIAGSNFIPPGNANASSLVFYDPSNNSYPHTPSSVTTTSMQYGLTVGSATGTWKVKVVNGSVESPLYNFNVSSANAQLTGLSISGPATINENSSGTFTAKAIYSDGSTPTVTPNWSVSGGNASIGSSSGQLTAGSVSANTVATVSASYTSGGVTKTASANVTIVDSGSSGTQTSDLIVNGSFESGSTGWTLLGGVQNSTYASFYKSPTHYLWFGDDNSVDTAYQTVFIPSSATVATLSFYLNINSSEPTSYGAYDTFSLTIRDTSGNIIGTVPNWSNLNGTIAGSYQQQLFNLLAYKGMTVRIYFVSNCHLANGLTTNFRVDDVSLMVTTANTVTPVSLSISGPSSVSEGGSAQYNATMIYSDGSTQPATSLLWGDNTPSLVSFTSGGYFYFGTVNQDTTVSIWTTATVNGQNYQAFKDITIVNIAPAFNSIAISGPVSMNENSSCQFSANAIYSDGSYPSISPNWSVVSGPGSISTSGVLTVGEVNGNTTTTVSASATLGGVTRTASQQVSVINIPPPPTLTSLAITGPSQINEKAAAQYTAIATLSDSSTQPVAASWSVSSAALGTISTLGIFTANEVTNNTNATVTASYTLSGITRTAQASVTIVNSNVASPQLTSVGLANNSGFQMIFNGTMGSNYTLQASSDLKNWTSVRVFTCTNSPTLVIDPGANYLEKRFYRVVQGALPIIVTMNSGTLPTFSKTNGLTMTLDGPLGFNYIIQTSTNLINWQPWTNFTTTSQPFGFKDVGATNFGQRFYRAVLP